ncbi:hypothetical protein SprV_0501865000 [Sparganum proliferum]
MSNSASSSTSTFNTHRTYEPPLTPSSVASTSATAAPAPTATAHNPDTPTHIDLTTPTPAMCTPFIRVLIATAPPPHTSAWSVTCVSIAQRLANQCLEHQPTPAASASAVPTARMHPLTARAYWATFVSTETCGRQPPATPHHHILSYQHHIAHQHLPPQAPKCHLLRKWEVCVLAPSPRVPSAACVIRV